jgi:predicted metal-dependent TIM-barrel fold hydrolase
LFYVFPKKNIGIISNEECIINEVQVSRENQCEVTIHTPTKSNNSATSFLLDNLIRGREETTAITTSLIPSINNRASIV